MSEILLMPKFFQTTILYKMFEISDKCLLLRGAYFHGVLINTCNFFCSVQLCGNSIF